MNLRIEKIEQEPDLICGYELHGKDCWKQAKWFVEGFLYCDNHKEEVLKMIHDVGQEPASQGD